MDQRDDETRDIPAEDPEEDVDRLVFPGPAEHPPTHQARPSADLVEPELHDEEAHGVVPEPPSVLEPR